MDAGESERCWGILWRSDNSLDGHHEYLLWDRERCPVGPVCFKTRTQARKYRDERYGYIRGARDLKAEPHGWKLPRVVRLLAMYEIV